MKRISKPRYRLNIEFCVFFREKKFFRTFLGTKRTRQATDGSSDSSDKEEGKTESSECCAASKKAKKGSPNNSDNAEGAKPGVDNEPAQTFDPRLWWAAATAATANNEAVVAGSGNCIHTVNILTVQGTKFYFSLIA